MRIVLDIEADGFYDDVKNVWCIVAFDIDTEITHTLVEPTILDIIWLFKESSLIIGHNIIDYDLPVLDKIYGLKYRHRVFDTYTASCLLNPDRRGGHSLASWGKRLGFSKGDHNDFSKYSPEMLKYCINDVAVTKKVYDKLRPIIER